MKWKRMKTEFFARTVSVVMKKTWYAHKRVYYDRESRQWLKKRQKLQDDDRCLSKYSVTFSLK